MKVKVISDIITTSLCDENRLIASPSKMGMNNDDNDEPGEIQIYLWRFIPTTNIYVDDDADGQ